MGKGGRKRAGRAAEAGGRGAQRVSERRALALAAERAEIAASDAGFDAAFDGYFAAVLRIERALIWLEREAASGHVLPDGKGRAQIAAGLVACLAFSGEVLIGHLMGGLAEAVSAGQAARASVLAGPKAEAAGRAAAARARGASHPMRGEGPSEAMLARQVIVRAAVHDREKPRLARLSGELPEAVRAMVRAGWMGAAEAAALRRYGDDHELGTAIGAGSSWPDRERVEGGRGMFGAGKSAAAAAAWARYVEARAVIGGPGGRMVRVVEGVMVQGVSLGDVAGAEHAKVESRRAGSGALLLAAGEMLAGHYRAVDGAAG